MIHYMYCDDGELFEDTINESFLFDDNVLKNSSLIKPRGRAEIFK